MKTTLTVLTLALSLFATASFAAGTEVKKSIVVNNAKVNKSAAIAVGKNNKADVGSIRMTGAKVKKSIIVNNVKVNKSAAIAVGKGNKASVGSIILE